MGEQCCPGTRYISVLPRLSWAEMGIRASSEPLSEGPVASAVPHQETCLCSPAQPLGSCVSSGCHSVLCTSSSCGGRCEDGGNVTGVLVSTCQIAEAAWSGSSLSAWPQVTPHLEAESHWPLSHSYSSSLCWLFPPPGLLFPGPCGLQASAPVSSGSLPWPPQEGPFIFLCVTS